MKYKVGDIVRIKSVEELLKEGAIHKGLKLEESIDLINSKGGIDNLSFSEYSSLWHLIKSEEEWDDDFIFEHTSWENREAIVLDLVPNKLSFGDRVEMELDNNMVLNPDFDYYILSITPSLIFTDWMLDLVKSR